MVGIVTTEGGRSLVTGDIAGGEIPGHNMFQRRYLTNPPLATVESPGNDVGAHR